MANPISSAQGLLPTSVIIPALSDEAKFREVLTDYIKRMVQAVNDKEISYHVLTETFSGKKYFEPDNNNRFRYVFRKVIEFGSLPNTTSKSVNHGITTTSSTVFTAIYGTASIPGSQAIPLSNVEVVVDETQITITTSSDLSAYTETLVILEYIR